MHLDRFCVPLGNLVKFKVSVPSSFWHVMRLLWTVSIEHFTRLVYTGTERSLRVAVGEISRLPKVRLDYSGRWSCIVYINHYTVDLFTIHRNFEEGWFRNLQELVALYDFDTCVSWLYLHPDKRITNECIGSWWYHMIFPFASVATILQYLEETSYIRRSNNTSNKYKKSAADGTITMVGKWLWTYRTPLSNAWN